MGWHVGAVDPAVTYSTALDGQLFVDGVSVAGRGGWIHVRRPAAHGHATELATVSVRVRVRRSIDGSALLIADEILSSGRCDEVEAAHAAWNGSEPARRFASAVLSEFQSRIARARSLASRAPEERATDRSGSSRDE
jgi:hypothetical protein